MPKRATVLVSSFSRKSIMRKAASGFRQAVVITMLAVTFGT